MQPSSAPANSAQGIYTVPQPAQGWRRLGVWGRGVKEVRLQARRHLLICSGLQGLGVTLLASRAPDPAQRPDGGPEAQLRWATPPRSSLLENVHTSAKARSERNGRLAVNTYRRDQDLTLFARLAQPENYHAGIPHPGEQREILAVQTSTLAPPS